MRDQPLYLYVKEQILELIRAQKFEPGTRLPTDDELMASYGVSRITVRRALEILQREGLIVRYPRRGTFIAPKINETVWVASSMADVLHISTETVPVWMEWKAIQSKSAAKQLRIEPQQTIYRLRSLRERVGTPLYFMEAYVPGNIGEKLARSDIEHNVLLHLIEDKLDMRIAGGSEQITASIANQTMATRLKVNVGAPLLHLEITYFDFFNRPVEYVRSWYRADKFQRRNLLVRKRASGLEKAPPWEEGTSESADQSFFSDKRGEKEFFE